MSIETTPPEDPIVLVDHIANANGRCSGSFDLLRGGKLIYSDRIDATVAKSRDKYGTDAARLLGKPDMAAAISQMVMERMELRRKQTKTTPRREPRHRPPNESAYLTERGNAERLVGRHKGDIRYCPQLDRWLIWNFDGSKRWIIDDIGILQMFAKEQARRLWELLPDADPNERREILAFAIESERAGKVEAAIKHARTERGVVVLPEQLDADPLLLGCPGGVVDFHDCGKFRESRREDLITKFAAVNPTNGPCPEWDKVMNTSFKNNAGMISYVQRIFGLALTGISSVQEMWIFHGGGANGKNVILETATGILGDYAKVAPDSLLTLRANGTSEHPTELMDLMGTRLVVASETEKDSRLRIQLVKKMTGDTWMKGRYLYQDFVTFPRWFKLILMTNNRPVIHEKTNAIWRRIKLVPFTFEIPKENQIGDMVQKLVLEWPAILGWMIRGYQDFVKGGMKMSPPKEVTDATEEYKNESDPLGDFIKDRLVLGAIDPNATAEDQEFKLSRNDLVADYLSYCTNTGEKQPMTRNALFDAMRQIAGVQDGHQWHPSTNVSVTLRGFFGVRLRRLGDK